MSVWFRLLVVYIIMGMVLGHGRAAELTVQGTASTTVVTRDARIRVSVTKTEIVKDSSGGEYELEKIPGQLMSKVADISTDVVQFLTDNNDTIGVKELQTNAITLTPVYSKDYKTTIGYKAVNTVTVLLPIENVSATLGDLITLGANSLDSITFVADAEDIRLAQQDTRKQAAVNAVETADQVLHAVGEERKEITDISIQRYPSPHNGHGRVYLSASMPMSREAAADPPLVPVHGGEEKIESTVSVTVRF